MLIISKIFLILITLTTVKRKFFLEASQTVQYYSLLIWQNRTAHNLVHDKCQNFETFRFRANNPKFCVRVPIQKASTTNIPTA